MSYHDHDERRRHVLSQHFVDLGTPVEIIEMVVNTNPCGDNPYHGTQHCLTVAIRCVEAGNYYRLDEKQKRELALAGLFHDFGHPLSKVDKENIERAIDGWRRFGTVYEVDVDNAVVERLIWSTHFPHHVAESFQGEIIQDSDMMQGLEPDKEVFYEGLTEETGIFVDDITTKAFLRSQHINTGWARNLLWTEVDESPLTHE